ncbi:hypothetical protein QA596_05930 [Balneolales bacterium ANBcel1]|nr:hypothetical protein [Balneolales bacterium ANBcel1]
MILAAGLAGTLFFFPQIYAFNHVLGYWPGSIYDEQVVFDNRMILYRLLTLTWIGFFWLIPRLRRPGVRFRLLILLLVVALGSQYVMAPRNGLVTTASYLKTSLGGTHQTEHFTLYYSKRHYTDDEIGFLGHLHEFHFRELVDTLRVDWPEGERIKSYLYAHEWQMHRYTGARRVSFVPVWQRAPQMHIRKGAIDRTLRHEMVHVIAREFGNRFLKASWSIGMVEGLAVALSPGSSSRLTPDQLVASNEAFIPKEDLKELFSLTGFYRRPGAVAYAVSGSFTSFLLREYDIDLFKKAYRTSSLEAAYSELLPGAVVAWREAVMQTDINEEERKLAGFVFATPAIFDRPCPRRRTVEEARCDALRMAEAESEPGGFDELPHYSYFLDIGRGITFNNAVSKKDDSAFWAELRPAQRERWKEAQRFAVFVSNKLAASEI